MTVLSPEATSASEIAHGRRDWKLGPSVSFPQGCEETFRPYRHLAIRVLASALRDMIDPAGSAADRESARVFFADSAMLFHWCRVAALDPHWIADRAEKLTVVRAEEIGGGSRVGSSASF